MSEQNLTLEERLSVQEYLLMALMGMHADDPIALRKVAELVNTAIEGAEKAGTLSVPALAELRRQADALVGLHKLPDPLRAPLRP